MFNRREFLRGGFGALALGLSRRPFGVHAAEVGAGGTLTLGQTRPVTLLPDSPASVLVDGMPFAPWFTGDDFNNSAIPFHAAENTFPNGPPPPTEDVDVAIIGGGLSGLATALLLKRFRPVVFELRPRFGGNAQGEIWAGTPFSLGSAYFISPDPGSFLHRFYRQLGLHRVARVDQGDNPVELGGRIVDGFWQGAASPPEEMLAFQRYAQIVQYYATDAYPDIPLPPGGDNQWIRELDQRTLRDDIELNMGGLEIPPLLAAAIQAYCYSSFGVGWDEISAASGWNFIAAEEYGRWVLPGGNAYMVDAIWQELARQHGDQPAMRRLRGGCKVVDVRLVSGGRVQVTYADPGGAFRSLRARRVVMANSKHIAKYMLHDLARLDVAKFNAMTRLEYAAYVVANVLIDAPRSRDDYDVFMLRDGNFPMNGNAAQADSRFVDVVNGQFARQHPLPRTVLTLYWPLPWHTARFALIAEDGWRDFAERAARDIRAALPTFGLPAHAVRQVRLTRWGHAMPVAAPGLIADGTVEHLRRPFEGRVYFVNQDNWALPAVENSLLEAEHYAEVIARDLRQA